MLFKKKKSIAMDQEKVMSMLNWEVPRNIQELRGILGLTGYYRNFIDVYATLATSMTNLLKKGKFSWTPEANDSFMGGILLIFHSVTHLMLP